MSDPPKSSLFTPDPYYIPGYEGFYPQIRYQIGETYGKTTSRLLTDPSVRKSPCSVLAPLGKPRFIEDFSGTNHPSTQMLDQNYSYFPGYSGFTPYQNAQFGTCQPTPATGSRAPLLMLLPAKGPPSWADTDTQSEQRKYTPCHPGIRLACGHGWKSPSPPAGTPLAPEPEERPAPCQPDIALACGQQKSHGPCHPDIALACGQGWRSTPCLRGTTQPVRIEGVPLPAMTETVDVSRYNILPKLDAPNLIQRKAISGYTGFVPRFTWIMGVNYLQGVNDAMNEFDRNQSMLRNPVWNFGKRLPQTYWPNNKIYTSAGLMPFYTGFVPTLRHSYALTFGNSTRKVYQKMHTQKCTQ
ncbi:ciliary microtubule inner protein 2A [Pelodiscus sinensis]|uniref:ciliary microtubule inner protein 2A n=1 Tax=Pelodiscus sinensis TaxID=13735 RepID=UPI000D71FB5C|nr:protein FAM166A [Pelodiscus sinensis]|eukprot:XP_025040784.1 protein FAM166A [Pelodiscus sinensis]